MRRPGFRMAFNTVLELKSEFLRTKFTRAVRWGWKGLLPISTSWKVQDKSGHHDAMKLGILGGTFDPIHQGHLALAEAALKQFLLDKILFIPAAIQPHKTDCVSLTSGEIRLKMVQLAIRYNKCFEASDLELV